MTHDRTDDQGKPRPVVLVVLDGFGIAPDGPGNAVTQADTPTFDAIWSDQPHSTLQASGRAVGLPEGQMGNSEVGHMNLGAGRIVEQSLAYVQNRIDDASLFENDVLVNLCREAEDGTLHLMGLVSRGGVHSDLEHLFGLLELARLRGVRRVRVHAFTDGRDTAPDSGRGYLRELTERMASLPIDARVATVIGRYYAMDRDRRWDRTAEAYRAVVCGEGVRTARSAEEAIAAAYDRGETDEFVRATVIEDEDGPVGTVSDGDAALFFNFRADRARQLSHALADDGFDAFERCARPDLAFATLMPYEETLDVPYALAMPTVERCLAEVLADAGLAQYHTAETEKYPHVTYFFNAKAETPFPGEERHIEPSPKIATYDLQPEMSAPELTAATLKRLREHDDDFVLINYANPDMVGHTGDLQAAIRACEAADEGLGAVVEATSAKGGVVLVLADHGNAEQMIAEGGGPHTAHTTNPVPFVVVGAGSLRLRDGGVLGDVAPTVLELLGVDQPEEMTGRSLIVRP
ncbi:MAG: 2,3-bisphosphoglycerate-independent phosphoglycerate mutase [Trueperaceae bacterium]|nr:2,3-bisphosphoglycerate-independent phosphoglycerate mutase [Trueperaceae bacterium]